MDTWLRQTLAEQADKAEENNILKRQKHDIWSSKENDALDE